MHKKPTHLAGGAPRPIRKYRMTIAHRAAPLDPLDESLSTTAVAAGTPAVGRWPSCRQLASCDKITGLHTLSTESYMQMRSAFVSIGQPLNAKMVVLATSRSS